MKGLSPVNMDKHGHRKDDALQMAEVNMGTAARARMCRFLGV